MKRAMLALILFAAMRCGGTAVVDGGSGGSSGNSTGNGNPLCNTTEPVGSLSDCTTVGSAGTGPMAQCSQTSCDEDGNTWESRCEGSGCECYFNQSLRCSCVLDGGGNVCTGTANSCCPSPFPQ